MQHQLLITLTIHKFSLVIPLLHLISHFAIKRFVYNPILTLPKPKYFLNNTVNLFSLSL